MSDTSTTTTEATTTLTTEIAYDGLEGGYIVLVDGTPARNRYGSVRVFATRSAARKHEWRERNGNMHK